MLCKLPAIFVNSCGEERRTHYGHTIIQSNIYAADWSSLERIAEFFKVEIEGKSKLFVAKFVVQQLEEGIGKLKEAEVVPYLEDVKKLLTEKPSGIKDEGKSGKFVPSVSKPPSVAKEDSVQKLLATSALRRKFKISGQIVHFTVACQVTWPLNGSEAGGDLALIQTFLLYYVNAN